MARKFLTHIDLNKNELQNAKIQNLASAPASPTPGQIYYDTSTSPGRLYYWNGSSWVQADGSSVSLASATPTTIDPDDAGAVGTSSAAAREDHQHAIATAAAGTILPDDAAAEGSSSSFARADHKHAISAAAAGASAVGDVAAEGSSSSFARADHVHARESFGVVTPQTAFGAASTNGTATTVARSDHTHGTPAHDAAAHSAIPLSALAVPTADVAFNSRKITGLADPTAAQDAATKAYVDASASGLDVKASVRVATTANITLSGTQTIDGVAVVANNRVLVKNQTTASENGIWVVAAGAWARATDADTSAEVNAGMFTFVEEGTANGDSGWVLITNNPITLGTTALTFSKFSSAGEVDAGAGLTKTGQTLDVVSNHAFLVVNPDNIDIGTLPVNKGGTGATDAATARTNLGTVGKFAGNIGDGATLAYVVTHNLNTTDVVVSIKEVATSDMVEADIDVTSANTVTISFATAPGTNAMRVVVVG